MGKHAFGKDQLIGKVKSFAESGFVNFSLYKTNSLFGYKGASHLLTSSILFLKYALFFLKALRSVF